MKIAQGSSFILIAMMGLVAHASGSMERIEAGIGMAEGLAWALLGGLAFAVVKLFACSNKLKLVNAALESQLNERADELLMARDLVIRQQKALHASAKFSALGEMAGGIAHELNTPLAIISLRIEQLEERLVDGKIDEAMSMLSDVRKTTERISKIVTGLRAFAREGRKEPAIPIDIRTVIDETLSFCQERMISNGIKVEVDVSCSREESKVECRSVDISQALLNLLNNACDAIQTLPNKWVRISVQDTGQHVELSVTDSGRGVPDEHRDKVMQPFFTTKETGKGTGLGLSIARNLIESHGGKFFLDSDSEHTRFVVSLPKTQAKDLESFELVS